MKLVPKDAHWSVEQLWFLIREICEFNNFTVFYPLLGSLHHPTHLPKHLFTPNYHPLTTTLPYAGYSDRARRDKNFGIIFIVLRPVTFEIFHFEIFSNLSSKLEKNQTTCKSDEIEQTNFYVFHFKLK